MVYLLALLVIALTLWAASQFAALRRRADQLSLQLRSLEFELRRLRPPTPPTVAPAPTSPPSAPASSPLTPPPPVAVPPTTPVTSPPASPATPPVPPPLPVAAGGPSTGVPGASAPFDWERFGAKLFAWLGGFAAFLGAVFFVRYSFEHDLIPASVRVALGFAFGAALVAGGWKLAGTRYGVIAHTLVATGIVSLYAITYACNALYHFALFGQPEAFALMSGITLGAFALGVRLDARVVAVLGVVGGFLTPVVLSTGTDNPPALFGYVALLDAALIALALHRRWFFLVPLGAAATVLTELAWAIRFLNEAKTVTLMIVGVILAALFSAGVIVARRLGRRHPTVTAGAFTVVAVSLASAAVLLGYTVPAAHPIGWFSYVLAIDACLLALAWFDEDWRPIPVLAAVAVFALLTAWTALDLRLPLLPTAIGLYVAYAAVQTGFALADEVRRQGTASRPTVITPATLPALLSFLLIAVAATRLPAAPAVSIFGPTLALTAVVLAFAARYRSAWLPLAGLAGVLIVELTRQGGHLWLPDPGAVLAWYAGFIGLFAVFPFACGERFEAKTGPWATAALAPVVHFPLAYLVVRHNWPTFPLGLLPLCFGVPPALGLLARSRRADVAAPARRNQLAWFGGATLLFLTLVIPAQCKREWLTLGWALEGAALLWLFRRVPQPGLRATGVALLATAFVRLALNPAVLDYHARAATPVFNWLLYVYGAVAAAHFVGARLAATPRDRVFGVDPVAALTAGGVILLFLLLNLEIAEYFSPPGALVLTFEFSGNFARDMSYTIGWALFALVLLLLSLWQRTRAGRYAAFALLAAALLKLFLHDLANLNALYRIGALFAVATIALLASFAYQRFLPGEDPPQ